MHCQKPWQDWKMNFKTKNDHIKTITRPIIRRFCNNEILFFYYFQDLHDLHKGFIKRFLKKVFKKDSERVLSLSIFKI